MARNHGGCPLQRSLLLAFHPSEAPSEVISADKLYLGPRSGMAFCPAARLATGDGWI